MFKLLVDRIIYVFLFLFIALMPASVNAQYFGKNKVQYEDFDFKVKRTPHFALYHYLPEDSGASFFAQQAERWYDHHQRFFKDTFSQPNPLVLYNNHADFQQTAVITSRLSPATSGVTEGLKNRVVMPFNPSRAETHHVLGHELVHAFQYHLAKTDDSLGLRAMGRQPLWFIEGMAEYLSIGRLDAHTAMWMRDAVLHDDVPSVTQMTRQPRKYFPYRYGQAFWAFMTGYTRLGDSLVRPLFRLSGQIGVQRALDTLFRISPDSLAGLWEQQLEQQYRPFMQDTTARVGDVLAGPEVGSNNLSPVISPDGRKVIFLSDKSAININLYIARTETGEIIGKLSRKLQRQSDIDDYSYVRSAGTWSPDSRYFAFTTYQQGKNQLVIVDAQSGDIDREIDFEGLPALSNPSWSPSGEEIVVSGMRYGQSDLYVYDLENEDFRRLTDDPRSALHPDWSPSGDRIVYVRESSDARQVAEADWRPYELVIYDLRSESQQPIGVYPGAHNLNPQFGPDGRSVYFLSDAHGFRDLYEVRLGNNLKVYRRTHYFTGISGFSSLSPAFSLARDDGKVAYSLYRNRKYSVITADLHEFPREEMDPYQIDRRAAELPPITPRRPSRLVQDPKLNPLPSEDDFTERAYEPRFGLSNLGPFGAGVATGPFGTGVQGGISAYFSDMLNYHQLFTSLQVSGRIIDAAGQATYINRKQQLNWGASLSHIPYRRFFFGFDVDTGEVDGTPVVQEQLIREELRIFQEQAGIFTQYPFSRHLRVETGLNMRYYHFRLDSVTNVFAGGVQVDRTREQVSTPYDPFWQGQGYAALVGDHSDFGLTGPLQGRRFRLEASQWFLEDDYFQTLADYRTYFYRKPWSLAFRGLYIGRYGPGTDEVSPFFIGSDYFVRGYAINTLSNRRRARRDDEVLNQLIGSKMAVTNAELRLPFTGPEQLAVIPSGSFFSTLVGFADAGAAWGRTLATYRTFLEEQTGAPSTFSKIDPIASAGLALRLNLFGAIIVEGYAAAPFMREEETVQFGFTLLNGGF